VCSKKEYAYLEEENGSKSLTGGWNSTTAVRLTSKTSGVH
jgi:hypothetical protein